MPGEAVFTLSAGPGAVYPAVLRALSKPGLYDYDPQFLAFFEAVAIKTARALRVPDPALILQCEPAVALEATAASLIGPDDVVLNLASGVYGKGFGYWSARYHKEMVEIEVPYNEAIDPAAVAEAFRRRPDIKVVSLVHHETPSGTINPADEIGRIVRANGALLLVDAVSSFGGMDIHPIACHADVFVAAPSKCLGGVAGLSILSVTDRAWAHIAANPKAPFASALSLKDWKDAWRREKPFPFTPSTADMNGLDAALDLYLDEGPENVWRRHALTAAATRAGVKALGLELWAARESIAAPALTAVRVPAGLDAAAIVAAARDLCGVVISDGSGDTMGKLLRIGHMGPVAHPIYATVALTALGQALRAQGHKCDIGAAVEAAVAASR